MLHCLKRGLSAAIVLLALFHVSPTIGAGTGSIRRHVTATMVLLGDTAVESQYASLVAGKAEAFRLRADKSGLAAAVHVYVDARTSVRRLTVGLYSSARGHPGTLLSTGSTSPEQSTWATVSIAPVEILVGRSYWLAILDRGGRLHYRDRAHGRCPTKTSAKRNLRALPTSWKTGATYSHCAVSAYVTPAPGAAGSVGPQVFVSQAGAGGQSGVGSCSEARSLSWLDSEGSWGSGAGKVAPGTTVELCGIFTEQVDVRGSGSSGEPVTMFFTAGAKIAIGGAGCPGSGCINVSNGSEYVTIDGGVGGAIENTERSYAREKEQGPPTTGVVANGCRHCSIEDLDIGPLYVSEKGDVVGNTEIRGIESDPEGGSPEYISVDDDVFHDMGWAVNIQAAETTSHIYVEHDTFYHLTHGFTPGSNFNGGDVGPVVFAHNRFYGNSNWEDGEADTNHVDGVHCFGGHEKTAHYTGLYIYDNYITTEGANTTGPIFLEGTNGGTPCSDKTSNIWIFNNVLTGNTCCGLAGAFTGEDHTYNNTMIGAGPSTEEGEQETCETWNSDTKEGRPLTVANRVFKNNVVTSCHDLISAERFLAAPNGMEHNLWANAGSGNEVFACDHGEVETGAEDKEAFRSGEIGSWVTCMQQPETESRYLSTAKLQLTGQAQAPLGEPESGSQAIGHGKNLTSLCSQTPEEALCKNIDGETRPNTGPWNIGAY